MAKQEPSVDQWLKEAKADPKAAQCGMFLTHNGVVRITPKAQVREGVEGLGEVSQVEFSYDEKGLAAAVEEALTWEGVYYVRVWSARSKTNSSSRRRSTPKRDAPRFQRAACRPRWTTTARTTASMREAPLPPGTRRLSFPLP